MKRFVWRLQRVLDIRATEEQVKRAELLAITEQLARKQGELLMQKRLLKNFIEELSEEEPAKRLGKQEFFLRFSRRNDEHIRELDDEVTEFKKLQKEKIAEVLKIRQFKEGLEKLRVEAQTTFVKEQEKLEQKEADEMTIMGFARKTLQQDRVVMNGK